MPSIYKTKDQLYKKAQEILNKNIREFIPKAEIEEIERKIQNYGGKRKGYLGELVEVYLFGIPNNGRPEADFPEIGVELKTTPLKKHNKLGYAAKERLVFSMIDYIKIPKETWEKSTFLNKNKLLLLMFYLYLKDENILDSFFKNVTLLDLKSDIPSEDIFQIQKDWEFIRDKIARGEAHLLSEGDTFYLGACTKSSSSKNTREQVSGIRAKPRAFSLKPSYINFLLQKNILHKEQKNISILAKKNLSVEDVVIQKFQNFIGKTDTQILDNLSVKINKESKNYKRYIANMILSGTTGNKIAELEKAEITLKAITLEPSGKLTESISFPIFDYQTLVDEEWYVPETEELASFHEELDRRKFLFVVFQKQKGTKDIILKKIQFWNFPMQDLEQAKKVFEKTKECIRKGDYENLPKIKENPVSHVRPHGKNKKDTQITPQGTKQVKRCFWLNAKYIQKALENN